jgi:radical SAM protein with 4Fe4S-binding SPASM domain
MMDAVRSHIPHQSYPALYSFITYRKERAGGFLFNPYLLTEKWIDEIGIRMVSLCDGVHSIPDIVRTISDEFSCSRSETEEAIERYFNEFATYFALKWKNEPHHAGYVQKDSPEQLHATTYYSAPLSVIWDITYRCNLQCEHCLIEPSPGEDEMTLEEIESVLENLKRMKIFSITFSGGEPLVRNDIFDILSMASGMNFGTRLNTNGFLVNDRILTKLGEIGVHCIQVSLDGTKDTHDSIRGRTGSYTRAVETLRKASSAGFYTIMSTTITRRNLAEIEQLMMLADSLHVSTFKLNGFMPAGRGREHKEDLIVPKAEITALVPALLEKKQELDQALDVQLDALYPWLVEPPMTSSHVVRGVKRSPQLRCSAGQSSLVITPGGTVLACPYLTSFPLGNIRESPLEKIWHGKEEILVRFRNLHQEDLAGKCRDCGYVPEKCPGGCRALSYNLNGEFFGEDPYCWKSS